MGLGIPHTPANAAVRDAIGGALGIRPENTGYVVLATDTAGTMAPQILTNSVSMDAVAKLLGYVLIALKGAGAVEMADAALGFGVIRENP